MKTIYVFLKAYNENKSLIFFREIVQENWMDKLCVFEILT